MMRTFKIFLLFISCYWGVQGQPVKNGIHLFNNTLGGSNEHFSQLIPSYFQNYSKQKVIPYIIEPSINGVEIITKDDSLNSDKANNHNAQHLLIPLIIIGCVVLANLVFLFFMKRKIRSKDEQIEVLSAELNYANTHIDSIAEGKTTDLQNALRKAEERDRFKSAFLANMSHEIRTPLNGILGFARLLDDDSLSPHIRKQYIEIMTQRGNNLTRIVNDMINISQIDVGQLQIKKSTCNVNKLLSNLFTLFENEIANRRKENVKLNLVRTLSDSRSCIVTDPIRLEQILFNLIENAMNCTLKGSIEFGYLLDSNQHLTFFVKDTSSGIPADMQDKIFTRYTEVENPYLNNASCSNLGLSIAKGLVELLEGKIWFETKAGEGTSFFFTIPHIPANQNSDHNPVYHNITAKTVDFSEKVILVVEDDLISYQLIEILLKDTKAKLIHVKNGEDAVEVCGFTKNIDLVLMDMRLPFLNGYEATSLIVKQNPNLKVIAQTANAINDDREQCIAAGCCDYIAKPIDPDEFIRVITNHLLHTVNM